MSTDWVNFKELRAALNFSDVLTHYGVTLRKQGQQHVGPCPLPNHPPEKRDKQGFSANFEKGVFQCFICKGKGNALDFAVLMESGIPSRGGDVRKTAIKLQEVFKIGSAQNAQTERAVARDDRQRVTRHPHMNPPLEKEVIHNAPLDFELRDLDQRHPYLLQRGFAPSTINHFGLGFCRKGYLKDRAAIPLHDLTGKLIGYAGRLTTEHAVSADKPKYLFPGERSRNGVTLSFRKSEFLYNAHRLTPRLSRLLIVEGFTSVWWLHQLGIREVVAVMGSSIAAEQVMLIANHMADNGIVSVLFDGDEAGRNGAVSAVTDLASVVPVRLCHLGDGQQPTDLSADDLHEVIGW